MNPVQWFRELSDERRRTVFIAVASALGIALLIFIFTYSPNTVGGQAATQQDGAETTTTLPGTVVEEPPIPSAEYEGVPTVSTVLPADPSTVEEEDEPAQSFDTKVISAAQAETIWPASESGLSAEDQTKLNALARQLVQARTTGVGREQFPTIFRTKTDPDQAFTTDFKIEFSVAMTSTFTQNDLPLARTIVGWSGVDPSEIVFAQVRVANYFVLENGQWTAVPTGNLRQDLQRTDGLLDGVTIYG